MQILNEDAQKRKDKVAEKVKDSEQRSLALNEVDLETRKRETALREDERETIEKTTELFGRLSQTVRTVKQFNFLSEEEHEQLDLYDLTSFLEVKMGAEAVYDALKSADLDKLSKEIREELTTIKGKGVRYVKLTKRLKLVDGLRLVKIDPSWMIMKVIPVLPPDLRPMVQLTGGRFATCDLNDLYRRVINRNNRLKHLIDLGAPEIILRNEKRMLQEAVDSLIDALNEKQLEEEEVANH